MGSLARPSSAFHHPLDQILGSQSATRILRTISHHGGYLSATSIADRASLNLSGTGRMLRQLVATGVIETVGQGRNVLYHMADQHWLVAAIQALFQAESRRADEVPQAIRTIAESMDPPPTAIWLFGSTARREDDLGSDYDIAVVAPQAWLAAHKQDVSDRLFEIGTDWFIMPTVISLTPEQVRESADTGAAFWQNLARDVAVLFGDSPRQVTYGQEQRNASKSGRVARAAPESEAAAGKR